MSDFLSFRLFRVNGAEVTVSSLLIAAGILVLTWIGARLARRLVAERILARTSLAAGARYAVGRVLAYLIWIVGGMFSLNAIGVNATSLAAFGAALGVGIGFGLQDIVKNFIAGIIVLLERPVMVGDRIEIDGTVGDVVEIRTRSTVIRTNDDVHLIVPNAKFITSTVTNWSFRSNRIRFHVPISVAASNDPHAVEEALRTAAGKVPGVLAEPGPTAVFKGFGQNTLDFELLCWTEKMLHRKGALFSQMNFLIWDELARRHIGFPNPQIDVHLRSGDGSAEALPGMEPATSLSRRRT